MRNLIIFGLLIILLIAAQFASAKTVDEVIEKYIRARGGKNKLATVKSIYMEGVKELMGKEAKVKIVKERDKLSRTEIETDTAKGFILVTDKAAWTFFPLRSPGAIKIPDEDLAALQTELDIMGPLVDYAEKSHKATLLGKEAVEGNTCFKIKLTTNAGKEMMFWIDANTYLLCQSTGMPVGGSIRNDRETFTLYKNYKEVEGMLFAHIFETKTSGTDENETGTEIFFNSIRVNDSIDSKMFLPE